METEKRVKVLLVLLALGLAISVYLVYVSFNESALFCPSSSSSLVNCETVLTSSFSRVFGVPLSFYAFGWFAIAIVIAARFRKSLRVWSALGMAGLAYSIASMAEIGKICIYCSSLDVILLANFILVFWWFNENVRRV